ncbi:MAG: ribonuclease Y [Calditrichaeota bacterium]|nr:MAG: ribonuclease Y [Calditrichota bacterium]MBL1204162.1 ribonuclease Y [Calditrichota bacterium]NOG43993.1 ribonuclease Y [Calditrichota bacterium]
MTDIVVIFVIFIVSFFLGWLINSLLGKRSLTTAKKKAETIIQDAQSDIENLKKEKILEANEEAYQQKQKLEEEFRAKRNSLKTLENDLLTKDNNIDRKADLVAKKERDLFINERELNNREHSLNNRQKSLEESIEEANKKLEDLSGLTSAEAKQLLMENLTEEAKKEAAHLIYQISQDAKANAKDEARRIILSAMEQIVSNHTIESTVSTVSLPSDDMKGRIIGKEGRNIRAFEIVTGVDVIVDDTPQAVLLSAFDPYRRELAKLTMERLVSDGRIHPGRIEEAHEKVISEMDDHFEEIGEHTLHEIGIHGFHTDIVKTLGKLKYRSSYGQNVLQHCREVSELAGILASELDLDANLARRAGILHKIGLVVPKANESNFSKAGHEFVKKYGLNPIVLNAILAYGDKTEANSPIPILIQIAEEISQKRPGARREVIESYVKRLNALEEAADSFEGVRNSYAIQAGKEVRIIIDHNKADDAVSNQLATDIAKRIRKQVDSNNQIKVSIIREFRSVDYA